MRREYIRPIVVIVKCESESALLGNSINDADGKHAAPDVLDNPMNGNAELEVDNKGTTSSDDFAAKSYHWVWED